VNTSPQGRTARLRQPALTALSIAATAGGPAVAAAEAQTPAPAPAPASPALHASLGHHVLLGSAVKVKGSLDGPAGQRVVVQQRGRSGWRTLARTRTHRGGRFGTAFRARHLGRSKIRVTGPGGAQEVAKLTAYRAVGASWYGPGFYGHHLACGGTLSPGRIGVANKTLPCGTRVRLRYRGRTVTAPVIDRGPYVGGRTYDLTAATKNRLRFAGTGTVWSSK
jgi:hypothetical protein